MILMSTQFLMLLLLNGKNKKIVIINDKDRLRKDDIDRLVKEAENLKRWTNNKELKLKMVVNNIVIQSNNQLMMLK